MVLVVSATTSEHGAVAVDQPVRATSNLCRKTHLPVTQSAALRSDPQGHSSSQAEKFAAAGGASACRR